MELRHLRYFIRAAEYLHFTRAAESLYISQPSLSVHIQQLEDELKTKLFDRVGRQVRLTDAGKILLSYAQRAVAELEEAGKEIEAITGHLHGPLSIATLPLYGSSALPPWINAFNESHPHVRIRVHVLRAEEIESGLIAGDFDLGFSLGPPEHSQISSEVLMSDYVVVAVAKNHALAKKKTLSPADFKALALVLPSHNVSSTRQIGNYFEAINVVPNIISEQDDGHAMLELVKLGGFATLLPDAVIRHNNDLCFLPLPPPGIPISIMAMWTQLNPATSAFMDIIREKNKPASPIASNRL